MLSFKPAGGRRARRGAMAAPLFAASATALAAGAGAAAPPPSTPPATATPPAAATPAPAAPAPAAPAPPTPSAAPSKAPDAYTLIQRHNLRGALATTRLYMRTHPNDPIGAQLEGILLVATGHIRDAEAAFAAAVKAGPDLPPTDLSLDQLDYTGSALHEALNRQRVTIVLDAGAASALNNLGVVQILLGRAREGMGNLDRAMAKRPSWGPPEANSAVAWLIRNKPQEAASLAQRALDLGLATPRVYASLAEAAYREEDWDRAKEYLKQSSSLDPFYPFALYLQARLFQRTNDTRDAERALFQSLELHPGVAAEDRYFPHYELRLMGGDFNTDHQRAEIDGQPSLFSYELNLQRDRSQVDSRSNTHQEVRSADAILGGLERLGNAAVYLNVLNEGGGRPGPQPPSATSDPNATYGYDRFHAALLQRVNVAPLSRLLLRADYRTDSVLERLDPAQALFRPLKQRQWSLEGRLDKTVTPIDSVIAGISYLNAHRDEQAPPDASTLLGYTAPGPIEPDDQVLPPGNTKLWTLYLFFRHQFTKDLTLNIGPVLSHRNPTFLMPMLDTRYRLAPRQGLRLSVRPRVMNANSDLFPMEELPERPFFQTPDENREGRVEAANEAPIIESKNGRTLSYEFEWSRSTRRGAYLSTTAFHREFNDMETLSDDPRVTPYLVLTPLSRGQANGLELRYSQPLVKWVSMSLESRVQDTHGTAPTAAAQAGGIENFPRLENHLRFSFPTLGRWYAAAETTQLTSRTTYDQIILERKTERVVIAAPGATGSAVVGRLYVAREIGANSSAFINVSTPLHSWFYTGYPLATFITAGITVSP